MRNSSFTVAVTSLFLLLGCEQSSFDQASFDPLRGVKFAVVATPEPCLPTSPPTIVAPPSTEPPPTEPPPTEPPPTEPPDPTDPPTEPPPDPTDPPDECDVPLLTRTQGFWKNHTCVIDGVVGGLSLLPVSLGATVTFDSSAEVQAYFQTPPKGDPQIILGHQLLAAKFNAKAFGIGNYVFADVDADGDLETVDELLALGDVAFDEGDDERRLVLGAVLDELNNAGDGESLPFNPACGGKGGK
ncbi:hypothetical protein [Polyangium sp. 15x6]|uniref:hypothetical protein n=1 Tax=Polyangium sp. 15x6 TaxID=3042687 RepID=UPI00249A2F13|nr:hypothetical protein [Polyangium sp. 15x6]MDI3285637.1 hypothetical protein [Polyangium sp. 15x6]